MDAADSKDFRAAWWLPGPHLQTVWGRLARSRRAVPLRREVLITPDGDELLLDHLDAENTMPRVLMLHGLEGSSNSVYMQGILSLLAERGLHATVMNFRHCARDPQQIGRALPNRGLRLYHSGETSDFDFVSRLLHEREPSRPLLAFGASLGGNVLLKWLGENAGASRIARAATLSVPYDLAAGARHLEQGVGRLYARSFIRGLAAKAESVCGRLGEAKHIDLERGRRAQTFYEFDDAVTAPLHGFDGADDYYARSSSLNFVERITVPTLCISAVDDPFLPPQVLEEFRRRAAPSVQLLVTEKGGHVGFIAGPHPLAPRYWAEERVVEWLATGAPPARRHAG